MAALPIALNQLEEQLTCAVCLDIYTNPKTLPCLHSFCLQCLEGLPVTPQGNKCFIKCPTCRTTIELPEPTGPAGFPNAFHLNNLKETYNLMKNLPQDLTGSKTLSLDETANQLIPPVSSVEPKQQPNDDKVTPQLVPVNQDTNKKSNPHHDRLSIYADLSHLNFSKPTPNDILHQHVQTNLNPPEREQRFLSDQKWFHGKISRSHAEKLLLPLVDGAFLVRESQAFRGSYTLSVSFNNKIEHYQITKDHRDWVTIDDEEYFEDLVKLVEHYQWDADGLCCKLRNGVGKDFPGPYDIFASLEDMQLFRNFPETKRN